MRMLDSEPIHDKSVQTIHKGFTHDSHTIHTILGAQKDNHGSDSSGGSVREEMIPDLAGSGHYS